MGISVAPKLDSQFYTVGGEVKQPGRQVYISSITVLGAIKSAGDFTDFGKKTNVKLRRSNGQSFTIDCKKALRDPKLDLEVFPNDDITVFRKKPWDL
jgi:protein involved in polysaccharide export with SLBB domain